MAELVRTIEQMKDREAWLKLRNKKCFRCMYLKAVSMGVECGIKKDR